MTATIEVEQFLPVLFPRDGVGNHTLATQAALRDAGLRAQTWAERFDPDLRSEVHAFRDYQDGTSATARKVLLYQASTGSEGMAEYLIGLDEPLVIYYHGITPAEFFASYDAEATESMRQGRAEITRLAPRARLSFAASEYSASELRSLGAGDVRVVPPYYQGYLGEPDRDYLDDLRRSKRGFDVLFVGRLYPHKGQMDLIRLAAILEAGLDHRIRLFLVGTDGPHQYMRALRLQAERLGVEGLVVFTGPVSQARLAAHYLAADVFVCLSEHEGFCVPVVEAMKVGLPVVARAAGAVKETMGGAGILLRSFDPLATAEVVARVVRDEPLRLMILRGQHERAAALDAIDRDQPLLRAVRDLGGA